MQSELLILQAREKKGQTGAPPQLASGAFRFRSSHKVGAGYLCVFSHDKHGRRQRYRAGEVDIFVGYVVPEQVWYIVPAHRVTGPNGKAQNTVCQFEGVRNKPRYECYREAWDLLGKERSDLAHL